jgi:hypothetical protein
MHHFRPERLSRLRVKSVVGVRIAGRRVSSGLAYTCSKQQSTVPAGGEKPSYLDHHVGVAFTSAVGDQQLASIGRKRSGWTVNPSAKWFSF